MRPYDTDPDLPSIEFCLLQMLPQAHLGGCVETKVIRTKLSSAFRLCHVFIVHCLMK